MISSARYFLYREEPFRVLYMHAAGFQEPAQNNERKKLYVWWFNDLATAAAVAASCSRAGQQTFMGERADFKKRGLLDRKLEPSYRRVPDATVRILPKRPKNSLESLA